MHTLTKGQQAKKKRKKNSLRILNPIRKRTTYEMRYEGGKKVQIIKPKKNPNKRTLAHSCQKARSHHRVFSFFLLFLLLMMLLLLLSRFCFLCARACIYRNLNKKKQTKTHTQFCMCLNLFVMHTYAHTHFTNILE